MRSATTEEEGSRLECPEGLFWHEDWKKNLQQVCIRDVTEEVERGLADQQLMLLISLHFMKDILNVSQVFDSALNFW